MQRSAVSASRQTGWLAGSPGTRSPRRSRRRNSSSEWKAARRRVRRRMAATPASSSTSRLPVEDPMNTLIPAAPGNRSRSGIVVGILARAADPEGEIAEHAMVCARQLVGESLRAGRERVGVGHLENRRDAACHSGARACLEIFLVGRAGLAEMHLRVDHARQKVQAGAVDRRRRQPQLRARRWRQCGPSRMPTSAKPIPSWLTTVPFFSRRSKISLNAASIRWRQRCSGLSPPWGRSKETSMEPEPVRGAGRRRGGRAGGSRPAAAPDHQRRRGAGARGGPVRCAARRRRARSSSISSWCLHQPRTSRSDSCSTARPSLPRCWRASSTMYKLRAQVVVADRSAELAAVPLVEAIAPRDSGLDPLCRPSQRRPGHAGDRAASGRRDPAWAGRRIGGTANRGRRARRRRRFSVRGSISARG